jgi:ethanolamine utilization cobalamin adenosyltransferase
MKKEQETALYGTKMVSKTHPRIILRGQLDDLMAQVLLAEVCFGQRGENALASAMGEVRGLLSQLMRCEVTGDTLGHWQLFGLNEKELRHRSHQPKTYFGVEHLFALGPEMGRSLAALNCLRTKARQVEIAAVAAFEVGGLGNDILLAMNRLSSAFYILMCQCEQNRLQQAVEEKS